MEVIDIVGLYAAKQVAKTVEADDVFLLGRPNSQRGDEYSVLVIDQAALVSYVVSKVPTPPPSGGDTIESGTFTLSADGSTATGGVVVSLGGGVFTFTIPTTKKLKLLSDIKASVALGYVPVVPSNFPSFPSSINGTSDGVNQSCFDNYTCRVDNANCISVVDPSPTLSNPNGVGWQFRLTSVTSTSMVFTATQIGSGLNITIGKWIATTGN